MSITDRLYSPEIGATNIQLARTANSALQYSTFDRAGSRTGKFYNGSPIYSKAFTFIIDTDDGMPDIIPLDFTIDKLVQINGSITTVTDGSILPIWYYEATVNSLGAVTNVVKMEVNVSATKDSLYVYSWGFSGCTVDILIEYTK